MLHPSEHVQPDCRPHPLPRCSWADRSLQPSSRLPRSLCARVSDSSLLPFILQSEITAHWLRPSLSHRRVTDCPPQKLIQSSFPPMLGAPVGQHPCPPV